MSPSVLTVGSFHAGNAPNAIPEKALLTGTTRTFDRQIWDAYAGILEPVIQGVCQSMGASYDFKFMPGYPPLENNPEMVAKLKSSMLKVVSKTASGNLNPQWARKTWPLCLSGQKGVIFPWHRL